MSTSDERLIIEVQIYSHLYDLSNKNHKNKITKENAWKEIGLSIGLSASRKQTPNSGKIKRAKDFIDAVLMKIGGETNPDLLLRVFL
ncbi:hypothetical protein TNIN_481311 [Trichonephila inaurata madagascariensis]|uniref:MADF domain-containing protein n=1 Tax=Trichonephila inaurata madagascariensis TaxID=2747483 RepID=A0A8X6XMA7_9ARAC|nr:hypothetical protein TNIN_481311 [Trichonephila inaurata madagascariensis]